ncbi:hypothetical protein LDENG_00005810 [Lucifuga dentata]|nr:hypothetical protein LDENG_00005810 [Lucifuga dentata]
MEMKTEKSEALQPAVRDAQLSRKSSTYLAKIAVILQEAPDKMLTFTQIPVIPGSMDCKRNYWKLDSNQITAKMARRHFKGILELFPELASKVEMEKMNREQEPCTEQRSPEAAVCKAVQVISEVKFSGPFSIESLLQKDGPPAPASRASPLSREEQQQPQPAYRGGAAKRSFSWDAPPDEPPLFQASAAAASNHGIAAGGAAERSFVMYMRGAPAPYFTSSHSHYITYPVSTFTHDVHHFWL